MNPATLNPAAPASDNPVVVAPLPIEEDDPEVVETTPYSHLEPEREGIVFAVACVLCSVILYAGVLVVL